jgi:hypothetical protein
MKRITILAAAGVLVATPAIGAWAAFGATDDQPARTLNVRVDDHGRHGQAEPGDDHGRQHRHGADDPAGHVRHSGELEPGDDHGGNSGSDDFGSDDSGSDDSGSDDGGHHGGGDD